MDIYPLRLPWKVQMVLILACGITLQEASWMRGNLFLLLLEPLLLRAQAREVYYRGGRAATGGEDYVCSRGRFAWFQWSGRRLSAACAHPPCAFGGAADGAAAADPSGEGGSDFCWAMKLTAATPPPRRSGNFWRKLCQNETRPGSFSNSNEDDAGAADVAGWRGEYETRHVDNGHELFGTLDFGLRTGKGASRISFHFYQLLIMHKRIPGFRNRELLLQS